MQADARAPHFVRSFERGLAVIRCFDAGHPVRTLSEVAQTCDLTRAAARRLLLTLADLGYVHQDGRHFRRVGQVGVGRELRHARFLAILLVVVGPGQLHETAAAVSCS